MSDYHLMIQRLMMCILCLLICMFLIACEEGKQETNTPMVKPSINDMSVNDVVVSDMMTDEPDLFSFRKPFTQAGPYDVGGQKISIKYQPRAWDEEREILAYLWYPTLETEGEKVHYLDIFPDLETTLNVPAVKSIHPQGYPVLVHSHGWEGHAGNSSFLMRHFASHGWIVIAPDHSGNTLTDQWDPFPSQFDYLRSFDITQSINLLEQFNQNQYFPSPIQTQNVILSGHSYGGYTAWATAGVTYNMMLTREECPLCSEEQLAVFEMGLRDDRVVGIIPMAESLDDTQISATGEVTVSIPILALSGSENDPASFAQQFMQTEGLDFTWVELIGACHTTFGGIPACPTIDREIAYQLINSYALAFARWVLWPRYSESSLEVLDGRRSLSDLINIQHHQ